MMNGENTSGSLLKPMHAIGAFAVIPNEAGHVLLCHRTDFDAWNLPGGVVEHGESPWNAVVREVEEETGLQVSVSSLVGVYSKPDKNELVFSFLCDINGGEMHSTDEADYVAYFSMADLPDTLLKKQKERILDWHCNRECVYMKEQFS